MEAGFEVVEHTADVRVIAVAPTLAELFEQAARGLYAVMAPLEEITERESRTIEAGAATPERLLVTWLLELLFLTESEGLLFSRFAVELTRGRPTEGVSLRATAWGEPIDPRRHELGPEVKAVTRHQLKVTEFGGGYRVAIVFDI